MIRDELARRELSATIDLTTRRDTRATWRAPRSPRARIS